MTETATTITTNHQEIELDENGEQRFSHYVNCPDEYPTTADYLLNASIEGFPVTALCGKVWVPSRDAKRFPVCALCVDEAVRIQSEINARYL